MVWINWRGSRRDRSGFTQPGSDTDFAFGRKQYPTRQAALDDWTGRGFDVNDADIRWNPLPGEPDNPPSEAAPYKPPARGESETAVENYRGYIIYQTSSGSYHLYTDLKEDGGKGLGLYDTVQGAEAGADADIAGDPAVIEIQRQYKAVQEQQKKAAEQAQQQQKQNVPCPRGDKYPKPAGWPLIGCDSGYMGQIGGDNCYCQQGQNVPQAIKDLGDIEQGKDPSKTETYGLFGTGKSETWLIILTLAGVLIAALGVLKGGGDR